MKVLKFVGAVRCAATRVGRVWLGMWLQALVVRLERTGRPTRLDFLGRRLRSNASLRSLSIEAGQCC